VDDLLIRGAGVIDAAVIVNGVVVENGQPRALAGKVSRRGSRGVA
jgi:hypothetical protein